MSELIKSKHPLDSWMLAITHQAQPRTWDEQEEALTYVSGLVNFESPEEEGDLETYKKDVQKYKDIVDYLMDVELIETPHKFAEPSIWERQWYKDVNKPPYGIHPLHQVSKPNKIANIDQAIKNNIGSSITEDMIKNFNINGMDFNQFLISNHLFRSLKKRLSQMNHEDAAEFIARKVYNGQNLLIYGIVNNLPLLVDAIIPYVEGIINEPLKLNTPSDTLQNGDSPLHIAIRKDVNIGIFKSLIINGGSSMHVVDSDGKRPVDLTWEKGQPIGQNFGPRIQDELKKYSEIREMMLRRF